MATQPAISVPGVFAPRLEVRRYVFEMRSQLGQLLDKVGQLGRRRFSTRRVRHSPPVFLVWSVHGRMSPGGRRPNLARQQLWDVSRPRSTPKRDFSREGILPGRPEGRAQVPPKLARMYTLGMDTIAGSKLLQLRFGLAADFQPDQAVIHGDRRARFIRMSEGAAIIRYWGDSHTVAVPPETLSLPSSEAAPPAPRALRTQLPAPAKSSRTLPPLTRTARRPLTIL